MSLTVTNKDWLVKSLVEKGFTKKEATKIANNLILILTRQRELLKLYEDNIKLISKSKEDRITQLLKGDDI